MTTAPPPGTLAPEARDAGAGARRGAPYGQVLAIAIMLALAAFLAVMGVAILAARPQVKGLGAFAGLVNQQNETAKSLLYLLTFLVILPLAVVLAGRLADSIAAGPNAPALPTLTALMAAGLAAALIAVRLSHRLPWGDGLKVLLAAVALWALGAGVALARASRGGPWPSVLALRSIGRGAWPAATVLVFGALLCVTHRGSLHVVPLALGAVVGLSLLIAGSRLRLPAIVRRRWVVLECLFVVLVALAVANVVVFHASGRLPNIYLPPGVIQNQQDYLLGSANQLLGGGALLVNVPVSQYGVGLIYFLDGWFHLVPIGYGTLGLLDSIVTALFYVSAYAVLRIAGAGRAIAALATAAAVVGLVYGLQYPVGALPETGPLRFGLPMALVLARVAQVRWTRYATVAEGFALGALGLAAVWAFEAFAYAVLVFVAIAAVQAWLAPAGERRRCLVGQALRGAVACVVAHLLLASITLLGTGHLPDWGQYLTYIRSFLLGGQAGAISYGFARWSPGLAVGAGTVASAAALVLLVLRAPLTARREQVTLVALAGSTAYEIALLSYVANRSSTYLLPYVTLPLVIAGALWLAMLRRQRGASARALRRGGVAFATATAVLVITAAWPSIHGNFAGSALAHAYPGGGLPGAMRRLWHPPPIDPRAPEGVRLLNRYAPGHKALVVLPLVPDLGVEILMRGGRANSLFIGDPVDDSLVPSLWMAKLTAEVRRLAPGERLLIDRDALTVLGGLRAHPRVDPQDHPIDGGNQQLEWLLRQLDRRFLLRPIYRDRDGLIVAELAPREG